MTQTIKHHLTDPILMAYSAGTLPEAFSLVVATHVSLCDECRARTMEFDAIGGEIMEMSGAAEVDEDSFLSVMNLIATQDSTPEFEAVPPTEGGIFPSPLRQYVMGDLDAVQWRRIGGGVSQAILPTQDDEGVVRLLKIPGGMEMPDHGHRGAELTLVLQGAFRDEFDRFSIGDVEVANEDVKHTPIAEAGEDCICLVATDAPLKFSGLIPRIAQNFIGI